MKTEPAPTTTETTPSAVPAASSPTGSDIPTVTHAQPEAKVMPTEKIDAAAAIGLTPKRLSPKDALGKLAEGEGVADRIVKNLKERGDGGRFKPMAPAGGKPKAEAKKPKPQKLDPVPPEADEPKAQVEPPKEQAPKQEAEKPKLTLTEPPKIKVGDKEMTQEEVARYIAELEAKAKPPEQKTEPPKDQQTVVETKDEQDAAAKQRAFIDATAEDFRPAEYGIDLTPETLDTILAGGEEGVAFFAKTIARVAAAAELRARQWASEQFNPILQQIDEQLNPVAEQYRQVSQYERERQFFEQHKDLTQYRSVVRNVAKALRDRYPKETAAMSAEEFNDEVANHVRQMAGEFGAKPAGSTEPQVPTDAPKAPRPAPPAGHAPSGGGAARTTSQQGSIIAGAAKYR